MMRICCSLSLVLLSYGCASGGGEDPARDSDVVVDTPAGCLEGTPCLEDSDCAGGYRCNLALEPPECHELFCAPDGAACSVASLCESGHTCAPDRCTPCVDCGGECVDLQTDRFHCGSCNRSVYPLECRGGEPACSDATLTVCGDECVDLQTHLYHCGACDNRIPRWASCENGVEICGGMFCDGACADPQENCGTCGNDCAFTAPVPGDTYALCSDWDPSLHCVALVSMYIAAPRSCSSVCADLPNSPTGLPYVCDVEPVPGFDGWLGGLATYMDALDDECDWVDLTCGEEPGPGEASCQLAKLTCICSAE